MEVVDNMLVDSQFILDLPQHSTLISTYCSTFGVPVLVVVQFTTAPSLWGSTAVLNTTGSTSKYLLLTNVSQVYTPIQA
jgi:branched-subunit amino acid transport protein AzlD